MSLENLLEDFALFDNWEDRYKFIIELGAGLEPLSDEEHNEINKVPGCVSQVWLVSEGSSDNIQFRGDSDAHIVKGLVAILLSIYSGKSAHEIMEINAQAIFEKLGLKDHLTPQRSNGFYAMVSKIRADAEAFDECRNP